MVVAPTTSFGMGARAPLPNLERISVSVSVFVFVPAAAALATMPAVRGRRRRIV